MFRLAVAYMRYYKSQTIAILSGIILTAALLAGISSLMYSSRISQLENDKAVYGTWHYAIEESTPGTDTERSLEEVSASGGHEDIMPLQWGKAEIRDIITYPYRIYLVYADASFLQMAQREFLQGSYPSGKYEIAADRYTLGNLGFSGRLSDTVKLDGRDYRVTGILSTTMAAGGDEMQVFVGGAYQGRRQRPVHYLRFPEDSRLYLRLERFLETFRLSGGGVVSNDPVTRHLGGERPDSILDIVKFALTDEQGNFTYIILKLQSDYHLAFYGMLTLLCAAGLFMVYSIFQISVSRRTAEYALMQVLGISEWKIGVTLVMELECLFLAGYPAGCLLGNGILGLCYRQLADVIPGYGAGGLSGAGNGMFHVSVSAAVTGFLVMCAVAAPGGFYTVYAMRRQTLRQTMGGDTSFACGARRIYSLRRIGRPLKNVVADRFMFSSKKKVVSVLISLSLGGCMFLCTVYMVENLKVHAELSMKSQEGLGAEYRISMKSQRLSDMIPAAVLEEIKGMSGLSDVYGTKYLMGELRITGRELEWEHYFDEVNRDSDYISRFGGICVPDGKGGYGIKYNVYGYEEGMISQLREFVLEGSVNREELENGGKIIAVANRDGQGNYNFYGKHPGDTITLRVPGLPEASEDVLKFQNPGKDYITKEFEIAAIVSRPLAQEEGFLNKEGLYCGQSLILAAQQMERLYGVKDYSLVHASAQEGADRDQIVSGLLQRISDVPAAALRDDTTAIETRKNYLTRQQLFFTGIAVILLVISLFHILNSMNYSILSRRREYGILRAMGITDGGCYRMIIRTGLLYGVFADILVFVVYHLVLRRMMDYYMMHIVQFLHLTAGIPAWIAAAVMSLNILIAVIAVLVPAGKIVGTDIVKELE